MLTTTATKRGIEDLSRRLRHAPRHRQRQPRDLRHRDGHRCCRSRSRSSAMACRLYTRCPRSTTGSALRNCASRSGALRSPSARRSTWATSRSGSAAPTSATAATSTSAPTPGCMSRRSRPRSRSNRSRSTRRPCGRCHDGNVYPFTLASLVAGTPFACTARRFSSTRPARSAMSTAAAVYQRVADAWVLLGTMTGRRRLDARVRRHRRRGSMRRRATQLSRQSRATTSVLPLDGGHPSLDAAVQAYADY